MYTYTRVHGRHAALNGPCTDRVEAVSARVHGRVRAIYTTSRVYAAVYSACVHEDVHGRVGAVQTARVHRCVRAV